MLLCICSLEYCVIFRLAQRLKVGVYNHFLCVLTIGISQINDNSPIPGCYFPLPVINTTSLNQVEFWFSNKVINSLFRRSCQVLIAFSGGYNKLQMFCRL